MISISRYKFKNDNIKQQQIKQHKTQLLVFQQILLHKWLCNIQGPHNGTTLSGISPWFQWEQ